MRVAVLSILKAVDISITLGGGGDFSRPSGSKEQKPEGREDNFKNVD